MKPLDLREYAMKLYNQGNSAEMELAKEILDLIIFEENSRFDEICESLDDYAKGWDDRVKQVEHLGDRSNLLAEIEQTLAAAGYAPTGTDDANDVIVRLVECAEFLQSEIDALNAPDVVPAVAGLEYDL